MKETAKCLICGEEKLSGFLAMHVENKHKIDRFDYAIKYLNHPIEYFCECGCGLKTKWGSLIFGWNKFILGHNGSRRGTKVSEESKRKISETLKRKNRDGIIINARKGKTKENDEGVRISSAKLVGKKLSEEHKQNVRNTLKDKYTKGIIKVWNKGETKQTNEKINEISRKLTGIKLSEERKKDISNTVKLHHKNNPEFYKIVYKKVSEATKENGRQGKIWAQSDIGKKELSRLMTEKNKNGRMSSKENLPNFIEKKVMSWFINELKYVGDGKYWVTFNNKNHKNPDFISINDRKKVVEIFGDYYHNFNDKYSSRPKNDYNEIIDGYKSIGFKCLIIWEHEIHKNPEETKTKISNFLKEV